MPPVIRGNEIKLVGELRRSQTVTTFGCGALIDMPRFSGIVSGIDNWPVNRLPETAKIHERNLEVMLGKECFYQISSPETENGTTFSVMAYRFPGWYYCPECHALDHFSKISRPFGNSTSEYNSELYCSHCGTSKRKVKLVPSRFIVACLNGHIQDFPYKWWVHRGKPSCESSKLQLEYKGNTGGLGGIHIKCTTCGAETTMAGCMDKDALRGLKCKGLMPWLGYDTDTKNIYRDPIECNAGLRVLQRSANNVYYSVNSSALTIPPWSEKLQAVFAERNSLFEDIFDQDDNDEIIRDLKKQFKKHPDLYGTDETAFINAAFKRYSDAPTQEVDEKYLRCEEYAAFCNSDTDTEYFKTTSVEVPDEFKGLISQIKQVNKLREVMVLRGFRRILPVNESDPDERAKQGLSNQEFSPISKQPLKWLPAIELYGEGIFIELNKEKVKEWEQKNQNKYSPVAKRHNQKWIGKEMFDENHTRYILLHTLAHLLIRQLSSQCGYATASLKEKIYSTFPENDAEMCGILIYTSATDTDGSLGGLVREGSQERIRDTLLNMLEESSWCSNDPICIDSSGQGYKSLNLSACHACALLPETSCEALNCLLDRASVVGTPDDPERGYFNKLL